MRKKLDRLPKALDPTGGLTDEDIDELQSDPGFQRMAEEADGAEREGRFISNEEVLRRTSQRPTRQHR